MTRITSFTQVSNKIKNLSNDQFQVIDEVAFECLIDSCKENVRLLRSLALPFFLNLNYEKKLRLISKNQSEVTEAIGFNPYRGTEESDQ